MSSISAGTTTTTGYVVSSDTTGALVLKTGASGTTALTIDTSQNMGLGVTPTSGWGDYRALQIGQYGLLAYNFDTPSTEIGQNYYYNGTNYIAVTSGTAARFVVNNGNDKEFAWYSATTTTGSTISWAQPMTLNSSGSLGIGVTSIASDAKLHVGGGLRAGSTTYNSSPFSTLFANTLAATNVGGSNRVVNFDGNGATSTSVWWTNGTRAYSALDANTTNNLIIYANDGTNWQAQANFNYGSINLLTTVTTGAAVNAINGVMTVVNPSGSNYNENLRLPRSGASGDRYVAIAMASNPASSTGAITGQFTFLVYPADVSNGQFAIRHQDTDALNIQRSGYVTTPLNPAFQAGGNSSAVYGAGWQKVLYTQSVFQRGSGYSSANSRFTAPVTGWYQFNAQWSALDNADTDGTFSFAINGSQNGNRGTVSMSNTGAGFDGHSLAATIYLATNDYVEVYRYSSVTNESRANDWQGWFSGHLIG